MLWAQDTSDVLNPSSWVKHAKPVFSGETSTSAYGPGHNSFFTSPDGQQDWIIYHANSEAGQGCGGKRSPRIQPFHWNDEGFPQFGKPVRSDELLPVPSGE